MGNLNISTRFTLTNTAQKMKFSIKNFFSKCDQIGRKLGNSKFSSQSRQKYLIKQMFGITFDYAIMAIRNS